MTESIKTLIKVKNEKSTDIMEVIHQYRCKSVPRRAEPIDFNLKKMCSLTFLHNV